MLEFRPYPYTPEQQAKIERIQAEIPALAYVESTLKQAGIKIDAVCLPDEWNPHTLGVGRSTLLGYTVVWADRVGFIVGT